jgi:UDP-glucose 4-epimerase
MNILVFGGGGFIGRAVTQRLLSEGYFVRVFQRTPFANELVKSNNKNFEYFRGDVGSASDVRDALSNINAVIHLASSSLPSTSFEDPICDLNGSIPQAINILDAMAEKGIRKIIYCSSGGTVYGNPTMLPIDESHTTNPIVPYGITKLAIEKFIGMYKAQGKIDPIILRLSNPYGRNHDPDKKQGLIDTLLEKAIKNKPIEIWGDGSITRDYLHIWDAADAFHKALKYSGEKTVFNISSGCGLSVNQIIEEIKNLLKININVVYRQSREFDVSTNILDNTLAFLELGWRPQIKLNDGLSLLSQSIKAEAISAN